MTEAVISDRVAKFVLTVDRLALDIAQHWLLYVNVLLGIFVLLPFAAPALMAVGVTGPADAIYFIYGLVCHQLPQRSFFLFGHTGAKVSYSLEEVSRAFAYDNIFTLRQFLGNEVLGWKVAWSDRMVSMFGSLWLGGLFFALFRLRNPERSRRSLVSPVAWLLFAMVPMALDGFSHVINDAIFGFSGTGFRDTNAWLQFLTGNLLPASFYAGDAAGSFNNLARLATGALFGYTTVWFLYPYVNGAMEEAAQVTRRRLATPRAIELGFCDSVDVTNG
jgi:uncharacterized membrane protein